MATHSKVLSTLPSHVATQFPEHTGSRRRTNTQLMSSTWSETHSTLTSLCLSHTHHYLHTHTGSGGCSWTHKYTQVSGRKLRSARSSSCPKTARHFPAPLFNLSPSQTHLCRSSANTLTPRHTQTHTQSQHLLRPQEGPLSAVLPACVSVFLSLSLPFSLSLPRLLPSLLCLCLSSTARPSGHTCTHTHTHSQTHTHTHTHTHAFSVPD